MANKRPNGLLSFFAWLLPASAIKTWVLRRLGNEIGESTTIGPNLVVGCGSFRVGDGTVIDPFNLFKGLARVDIGSRVRIGRFNQISADRAFQQYSDKVGAFIMQELSLITNRHYVDCSGQVIIGRHAAVGGLRTIIQSHEFDLGESRATIGKVTVGEYAMTGACCLLLKDSYVPPYSVLAAGTVLSKRRDNTEVKAGLYGGVPAKFIRELPYLGWYKDDEVVRTVKPFNDDVFRLDGS
jgi:acetyltransferase-like isoleucine patch superfamily enzyme